MRQGLAVALALAVTACSVTPHKAYDGPKRRDSELSFLKAGGTGQEYGPASLVTLRMIDGAAQRPATYFVAVLPGRHAVGLSETLRIGTRERTQFCAVELETAAGCTYVPNAPSVPADARVAGEWEWSVDMVVVAECQGSTGFTVRAPARCGSSAKVYEGMLK